MRSWLKCYWRRIWYTLCFASLGIIDQRRGSALGEIQMLFNNLTGIVIAFLLIPSLSWTAFRNKLYLFWIPICICLTVAACIIGRGYWQYSGQWISAVLNLSIWSYFFLYMIIEWKHTELMVRIRQPFFWALFFYIVLMFLSIHEGILPLWYLMIFGGFYIIGIPKRLREDFFQGMLNGIILWFFAQQILAFGFRHYDYIRYKGLYSGETQNGMFYMIAFCAFFAKWFLNKIRNGNKIFRTVYFFLSAGCVSFIVFTGGRAPLLGVGVALITVYIGYDIIYRKSFSKLLTHIFVFGLCIVVSFPLVYGCIRYLPTVLHHPIWFEGEYDPYNRVTSFDNWDSEKYITLEQAINHNLGRILDALGINYSKFKYIIGQGSVLKVYAAEIPEELSEPGCSPENPFSVEESPRKSIYLYYWNHLNWQGHHKDDSGFYYTKYIYFDHAHNIILQIAYDYGITAGVLFLGIYLYSLYRIMKKREIGNLVGTIFLLAIFAFSIPEMVLVPGQITVPLMGILFYFAGEDSCCVMRTDAATTAGTFPSSCP